MVKIKHFKKEDGAQGSSETKRLTSVILGGCQSVWSFQSLQKIQSMAEESFFSLDDISVGSIPHAPISQVHWIITNPKILSFSRNNTSKPQIPTGLKMLHKYAEKEALNNAQ